MSRDKVSFTDITIENVSTAEGARVDNPDPQAIQQAIGQVQQQSWSDNRPPAVIHGRIVAVTPKSYNTLILSMGNTASFQNQAGINKPRWLPISQVVSVTPPIDVTRFSRSPVEHECDLMITRWLYGKLRDELRQERSESEWRVNQQQREMLVRAEREQRARVQAEIQQQLTARERDIADYLRRQMIGVREEDIPQRLMDSLMWLREHNAPDRAIREVENELAVRLRRGRFQPERPPRRIDDQAPRGVIADRREPFRNRQPEGDRSQIVTGERVKRRFRLDD